MRALLLSVALLCGTSFGADEVPANVAAFKERCEAAKVKNVARIEKDYDDAKSAVKAATSSTEKAKRVKNLKAALEKVKEAEAEPWHAQRTQIDTATAGSIGEFFTSGYNHSRIGVYFHADKVTADKVTGYIVHDGATPKLLVRAGGAVANNVYSEPGKGSKQPATILGGTGFTEGKQVVIKGRYEVVTTKPLTLKPFDVEPFQSLK